MDFNKTDRAKNWFCLIAAKQHKKWIGKMDRFTDLQEQANPAGRGMMAQPCRPA
jgi:hypothetical protein